MLPHIDASTESVESKRVSKPSKHIVKYLFEQHNILNKKKKKKRTRKKTQHNAQRISMAMVRYDEQTHSGKNMNAIGDDVLTCIFDQCLHFMNYEQAWLRSLMTWRI